MTSPQEQAWQSGLVLLDETPRWNEDDWPPLVGEWRWRYATVVVDHTVVVLGGFQYLQGELNSVLLLNLANPNKQWRAGPSMSKSRRAHAAVVCNGGIYVMGGLNGKTLDCIEQINANDFLQQSSTSTNTHESHWTTLNCRLSTGRYGCCAVAVHNRYIVVMGGCDGGPNLSSVDILDTSVNTVIAGPGMNFPRIWCGSAVVGHRIFVVGGTMAYFSVEYLDFGKPSDNEEGHGTLSTLISSLSGWTIHSDLVVSASLQFCAVVTVGSCLVVAGDHRTVEILDTHHNRMWNLPPFRNRLENCSIVAVANQVAVIGGWRNRSCATLPLMDKNTWCFRQLCEQQPDGWFHSLERLGNGDVDS